MNIYCINIYIYIYNISCFSNINRLGNYCVLGHKLNDSEDSDDSNGSVDEENNMTVTEAFSYCDNLINFMERK
jgi:hypothetical protein